MESMVRKALFEFDLLEGKEKIGIALSGGKDSLSLLFLLHAISGKGFPLFRITAFFVDGEFTCGSGINRAYLHSVCDALNVPLVILQQKQDSGLNCYSCSRDRRKLIFEAAKERGIECIAFGHHRDDAVQTLLMNLFHKAEFASNLPKVKMQRYGVTIIRPLIFISEKEIRSFASSHGFLRILCRCPIGADSVRKKTEILLERIEKTFPRARTNLARAGLLYGSRKAETP